MRILLIILTFNFGQNLLGQTSNPFLTLEYDSVVIYDFEWRGKGDHFSIIDNKGKLAPTVKKAAKLDIKTAKKLDKIIGEKSAYGKGTAACFEPHLGIVYYKSGQPVAHITVCIDCNRLKSSIRIPAQEQGKQGEGEETYFIADGMSKSLRKYLDTLLKKYDFSHQIVPGSMFD